MKHLRPAILLGAAFFACATSASGASDSESPYPGYVSEIYSDPDHWLCRPDKDDVCDHDLDATVIEANGDTRIDRFRPALRPKFDCFYVYPTISTDPTGNSDLVPGEDQELFVVRQQAARLGEVCRVFAPVYRSVTLTALLGQLGGNPVEADRERAYQDVVDAWKHYVANDNHGRGVVLIGHSQGSGVLTALIANEIDPYPELRELLISAMLLGSSVQVPEGGEVGARFENVPLCRKREDVGCVVSYASFRDTAPPPPNSFFAGSDQDGWESACTNPASLLGGRGELRAYFSTDGRSLPVFGAPGVPWVDPALGVEITTPFVTLPGLFEGRCVRRDGFHYLEVHSNGDPDDPRVDDIIGADLTPEWGLHLVDANLAMGNLVSIARSQGRSWCSRHGGCPATGVPEVVRVRRVVSGALGAQDDEASSPARVFPPRR
jgi:hypothetical protein